MLFTSLQYSPYCTTGSTLAHCSLMPFFSNVNEYTAFWTASALAIKVLSTHACHIRKQWLYFFIQECNVYFKDFSRVALFSTSLRWRSIRFLIVAMVGLAVDSNRKLRTSSRSFFFFPYSFAEMACCTNSATFIVSSFSIIGTEFHLHNELLLIAAYSLALICCQRGYVVLLRTQLMFLICSQKIKMLATHKMLQ